MPHPASCPCGRAWPGTTQCHCWAGCHRQFSTVANFDAHKPGPRKADGTPTCLDPATLTKTKKDGTVVRLLKEVQHADGPVWVSWSDDPRWQDGAAA